jgi:N-acetylglutamate synthase-like GNAT family acetyltransferase
MPADLSILEFTDERAGAFHDINAAWIEAMFVLEEHDAHVLSHPRELIVDKGGAILFVASPEHGIIGAGALMPVEPGVLELTKMGVRAELRGLKAGEFLLAALIERARSLAPEMLFLLTSSKCAAAIHLYEKAGFLHDEAIRQRYGGTYARCDVAMRYPLDGADAHPPELPR